MTLKEKIAEFRDRQKIIVTLHEDIEPKRAELEKEFRAKIAEIEDDFQKRGNALMKPLDDARDKYKADLKEFCGITDGEKTNVLDLAEAIARLLEQA